MPSADELRRLALHEPVQPVLSIYARTDARDPANTNHVPAWLIALRNGLRAVKDAGPANGVGELLERAQRQAEALAPSRRGRSFAWFVTPDGVLDSHFTLQLPVRRDLVVLDDRPFISPLVEVVDRGWPASLVLVGSETVRVLQWEQGRISEPADSMWQLSLGDWRDYRGPAGARPGQHTVTQVERFEARVDERRRRFLDSVAVALTRRLQRLGSERILIAGEGHAPRVLAGGLGATIQERVVDVIDVNFNDRVSADLAAVLEPRLEDHWRREAAWSAAAVAESGRAGGRAALGPDETMASLLAARVDRLFLDPARHYSLSSLGSQARVALEDRGTSIAEAAVELAIAGGARVTAVGGACPAVAEAGGMLAALRY